MPDDSHSASDASAESNSQYLPASGDDATSPSHVQTDRRQITEEELPDGVNGPDELIRRESDIDCYTPDEQENVLCGIQRRFGLKTLLFTWEFNLNQNDNWVVTERVHASTLVRTLNWVSYHGFVYGFLFLPICGVGLIFEWDTSTIGSLYGPLARDAADLILLSVLIVVILAVGARVIGYGIGYPTRIDSWRVEQLEYGQRISLNRSPVDSLRVGFALSGFLSILGLIIAASSQILFTQAITSAGVLFILTPLSTPALIMTSQVSNVYHTRLPFVSAAVERILISIRHPTPSSVISKRFLQTVLLCFGPCILNFLSISILILDWIQGPGPGGGNSPGVVGGAVLVALAVSSVLCIFSVLWLHSITFSPSLDPSLWEQNYNIRNTSTNRQLFRLALSVIVCYIGTYSFVWGVGWLGLNIVSLNTATPSIGSSFLLGLVFVGLLPPLYIYAGICYQIGQTVTDTFQKWQSVRTGERLSKKDPEWNDDRIHSPVIVHGSRFDPQNAAAVQLFGTNYILLTESLYYDLQSDPDRLAAILSHEQSHIEHTDTLVSSVVSVVAPVLLLSEAAVYAMCDYKSREYRADLWALDQDGLSHEDLRDALDRVSSDNDTNNGPLPKGVAATPVKFSETRSRWKSMFQYFFSPYSVAVHPSLKNRKRTIDPNRERPPEAKGIQPE